MIAVGFAAHSPYPDESICRDLIHNYLLDQKTSAALRMYGVTSLPSGGDLHFAEACIALDIPLRVILPLPSESLLGYFDEPTRNRANEVIRRALSIEIVESDGSLDERQYECGIEIVLQSQLLLAFTDDLNTQNRADKFTEFARQMGRPVVWINGPQGDVQSSHSQQLQTVYHDAELEFLNRLPADSTRHADESPRAIAEGWLIKLDENALHIAPQVRRLAAIPIILTATAAFASGVAPRMHSMGTWLGAGAVVGLMAAVLPDVLRLRKRQALWVRIRTAAEVSRSVLALWPLPGRYRIVGPEILPELTGMVLALNYLKSEAERTKDGTVELFKKHYLQTRLLHQKDYFSRQAQKSAEQARRYRLVAKACTVIAVMMSAWIFISQSAIHIGFVPSRRWWVPLIASAFFQIATIAGALVVVYDCERRQKRYQELQWALGTWDIEMRALHTWPAVSKVVSKIERALMVELLEWRSLLQNMKMPRN